MAKEVIPISNQQVKITSDVNEIFPIADERYTRVIQGHPLELLCTFYGHPPPAGGLRWSLKPLNDTDESPGPESVTSRGLRLRSGRQYWTEISTATFDSKGRQTGAYECAALDENGQVLMEARVRVELYQVYVKIQELSDRGVIEGNEGDDGTITCNAYDGYHNYILPDAVYKWEFEKMNGDRIHPSLLASEVIVEGNHVQYRDLNMAARNFRARCIAVNNSARYVSPDFGFRVHQVYGLVVVKRPEIEWGGTRWIKGDGTEGVLLVISGLHNTTGHVSGIKGDTINLTCTAVDAVTNKPYPGGEFYFGWKATAPTGELVTFSQFADGRVDSYTTEADNASVIVLNNIRESPRAPEPTGQLVCLATRRAEAVTYVSKPVDYVVYPMDTEPDYQKEQAARDERGRIRVVVDGLDSRGMMHGTEGSVAVLKCTGVDSKTGQKVTKNVKYMWEFIKLDGKPVDTGVIIQPGVGSLKAENDQLTLSGLRRTSTIKARCVLQSTGFDEDGAERHTIHYSPYFQFDVTDDDGVGYRDFIGPVEPRTATEADGLTVKVNGLDPDGHLTGQQNDHATLTCTVLNATTNEVLTNQPGVLTIHYGWQLERLNGLPAPPSDIAGALNSDAKTGELQLEGLQAQSEANVTMGRCIAEVIRLEDTMTGVSEAKGRRYASPYFLVNVPPRDEVVPDYVDVPRKRYEVTVRGLNDHNVLVLKPGQTVELQALVRDVETDTLIDELTPAQAIGWQFPIYPSGSVGNPGDVARRVSTEPTRIILDEVRDDVLNGLRGRVWFYDGLAYYTSRYFPIVAPRAVADDGRVRVIVQETGTEEQRRYVCSAYDAETGAQLSDVSYDWSFTTSTGDQVFPSVFSDAMKAKENQLAFRKSQTVHALPINLRDAVPIEGRCTVLYRPYAGDLDHPYKINLYHSDPFILIKPDETDSARVISRPDPLKKADPLVAVVTGAPGGVVMAPEGGTVTLTCEAIDYRTMKPVENLQYVWDIQQRDGSPIDTGSVAHKAVIVDGEGGQRLTLVGIRPRAEGLRGRCNIINITKPLDSGTEEFEMLGPGGKISSPFFQFYVNRTVPEGAEIKDVDYTGFQDFVVDGDPNRYEVVVSQLDDFGRLQLQEGRNTTVEVKLRDLTTGELISFKNDPAIEHFGIESRYENGQPAPLSSLAELITIHGKDGLINLNNFRGKSPVPIQFRAIVERKETVLVPDAELGTKEEKKRVRYASQYFEVVSVKEGEEVPVRPAEETPVIFPVVDGINRCGSLPLVNGANATLICRPNDTRVPTDSLVYSWEIRHSLGESIPYVNFVAKAVTQQNNKLYLVNLQDPSVPLIGRCLITQTKGYVAQFSSPYFRIGGHGPGCEPNEPVVVPDGPGHKPGPGHRYQVLIRVTGLNDVGTVVAKPGENVTLKCEVLNSTTNESIPNASVGFSFVSEADEPLHPGRLASRYELGEDNELRMIGLYPNPNARGRCVVTLQDRVTLGSPYFTYTVQDGEMKHVEPTAPSYADKRVRVEISGLDKYNQISIQRVGEDASLRCQAIVVFTSVPLQPVHGVRYGWEWRYMDEDPVSTSTVAVSLDMNRERLGLRGIRAPAGGKGRNVKGRCVVHVPARQVDPNLPEDQMLVYGSEYFTIDVMQKLTTLDADVPPVPGRPTDGIVVKVKGLQEDGNLAASEKDSTAVTCEVQNATTGERLSTEGLRAEYSAYYGWEFADATGHSVDYSLFADGISTDAGGNLRLRGLSAPTRGDLPYKVRCTAVVTKLPESIDKPSGPAKAYTSKFFALDIKRPDGSSTTDVAPGETPPDIAGDLITLRVDGLRPDGSLSALPGEDEILKCTAEDTKTGEEVAGVIYGWELTRGNGWPLNYGQLAAQVIQDGSKLLLVKVRPLRYEEFSARGRCVAHHGRQLYKSDYFKINIASTPKGQEVEGDGRIRVIVGGVDSENKSARIKLGESSNFTCYAEDALTGGLIPGLEYGWDLHYLTSASGPELQGSLGPFAEAVAEKTNGQLVIHAPSVISPTGDQARFRCRVMNNSMVYTSPFYRISVDSPDLPGYVAEKEVFPKYRVKVTGLDDAGYLAATPGEKSTLKCTAYDSLTGEEIESVQYLWELKRSDGDAASTAELVTRSLHATDRQLEMDGLKLAHYTYKGRCMVRDPGSDSWDSSPYFYFKVLEPAGPELGPEETIAKTQANATDDRVLVKVDGLDPSGNLIGKVGDDSKLTCTARVNEGVTAEIGSRGWIFTDESGDSVPITNIAQNVQVSDTEGMLNLANLRPSKTGKIGEIKGKCVVIAEITSTKTGPDGQEVTSKETTLFQSDSFGVSITADGSPSDNPGGMDVQGRKVVVTVKGLAENGSLIGESGDKLTLSCVVEDGVTGEPVSNGVYSWEIRDSLGRPVTADQVAQNVVRKGNTIEFIHLRPTQNLSLHNQRFGRCVVYISTTDHLYRSAYFHMNVRRPSPRGATGPDDHVEIHINGITEDGILEAQEGDTKTLECTAQNKESKTALSNAESIYHFQFDGADPSRDDLYSGHIADEVTQEPLPEGGIRLILKGIKADTWHRGRCVVLYIPGGQVIEGEEPANKSVKKYTSNYFWPGVVGVSRPVLSAAEIKEEPSVVGGITYDPLIIVKVDKVSENGTILVEPGKDVELRGYAIDALTGRPVKDMVYLWELRTVDEVPLVSNQLADSLESGRSLSPDGQILKLTGYRSTGDGIRVRVLAKATDAVKNDRIRGHTYVSPSYTFQTAKPKEPAPAKVPYPEPKGKYDPDLLQVEVGGLNPDGTLSKKEGESVKLTAQVLDSRTGVPIEDELDVGWSLGTGPDNRPISWTALADSVLLNKSELILDGLKTTPPKTGGLRSHIEVTIPEEMLLKPAEYKNRTVTIKSDSFVIHVEPQDDKKLPVISDTEERDKTPFKNWIPGREPKNAVLVKVLGLKADNRLEVPPGGNLSLSCLASDAVSLRRIVPGDDLKPVFAWEVRDKAGGRLLDYGLLANGEVIITQPEMYASAEDAGKSVLSMYGIRLLAGMDPSFAGRCIVYLRDQIFRSPYFIIEVDQPKEMEDYHISPSDHWTPDTAIEVVVKNLDPDGNKAAFESSSTKLECEARDAKTHQPLANDQVVYGWQLINPINDALMTPLTEKAKISGPYLQMNQMHLPEWERMLFTLWGWCMVDLPSPDKQGEVRHYRSKPFALKIYPKDQEIKPEEEIAQHAVYAKVEGISGDGHLRGTAGEDRRIACHAIDTYTGTTYTSGHLTYGWDWRTLDGSLADIHEIADNIESSGNELHLRSLQATTPIKGRCVIIVRPTLAVDESVQESRESLIPKYYMSDFFFVDVKQAESGAVVTVDEKHPFEAVDQKVIVDVTPHVDDKIKMYANQTAEFQITAKSSDGSPVKPIRYGYELVYLSGQVAHSGEVAESINFDHHEGVLKLKNVQYPAKPIKLRFFAVMSPAETESGVVETEGAAKPHRPVVYRSAYYPVDVEPSEGTKEPKWTDRLVPVYDVSAQAYRVKVDGLDENGNAAGRPKEPMELDCTVFDKIDQEVDLRSNSFTWQLVDQKGNPTNPGNLADEVEIVSGRKLKLTGFRESAMREGIRGRCIINIQVPVPSGAEITSDMPPTQRYASPYFTFTRKEGAEVAPSTEETTGPETSPETPPPKPLPTEEEKQALRGFYLKLDSPVNPIYKTDDGEYTILARVQRPFELSCEVIFNEGFGHQVSSTGEPLPKLMWYYRQPEIPGDVPIPSQLFPVVPPRMETLGIKDQKNYKIVIDSDAYSFRDDVAEFQCNAHDEAGEKIASQIVFIQKVKEAFDVRIFDEDSRGRAYAFVNTDKTLTCYVDDIVSGERVEPESYQWEVNTADGVGEWLKAYSPRQPAENVEGWNSNQLLLRNLKLPVGVTTIEATYEFRCVAAYNSTFETISRPFVMNVRKKPKIHHIRIDREKPTEAVLNGGGMLTDTYDATEDYQLGCKPEVLDSEASAVWKKCEDSDCTTTRELMPAGDKLFLFANSTRYVDEGVFRCEVSLQLKEYNFKLTESKEIKLLRQAAPAIYSSDSISYTINDEMSLQCTDESSSPESTVDWSFEPSGAAPSERKNPILLGKKYAYGRIYIFAIARGQLMKEHSGRYTCTAKNPNGVSSSSIQVTVTEEIQRGTRLATRVRIRSSSSG
ncbi:unnamed protein product [Calicophoron daubneyi]|uniref:Ig-like domain-containing protein n=1 Tax=Calicophoron daubneyi TaxID=300641 RepID=A0AAV2SXC7_CALDB